MKTLQTNKQYRESLYKSFPYNGRIIIEWTYVIITKMLWHPTHFPHNKHYSKSQMSTKLDLPLNYWWFFTIPALDTCVSDINCKYFHYLGHSVFCIVWIWMRIFTFHIPPISTPVECELCFTVPGLNNTCHRHVADTFHCNCFR